MGAADYNMMERHLRTLQSTLGKILIRKNNKAVRNSYWIIVERIVGVGISTAITVLSARYLGADNYGVLSYGLTLVSFFLGIMKLGLDSIMVDELIRHRGRQGEFLGTSVLLRIILSILSILSIGIILLVVNASQPTLIAVAMIQSIMLVFQAGYVLDHWFQVQLKSKYVSIAKIAAATITGLYSVYLLLSEKGVIWFAASTALTSLVVVVVLLIFYKKQKAQKLHYSTPAAKYLLSRSHHFIVANIISLIYVQIDKIMIGNMIGNNQLGLYSAALLLCTAWSFVPDAIITSLRPGVLSAKEDEGGQQYLRRLKRLYFIIFWLSVAIAGVIATAAPLLVPLLFGSNFEGAVATTQIAVWYIPISILGVARNIWLIGEGLHKYAKYLLVYGVIINVSLNLLLIPGVGIVGAAIATLVTEVVTCFVAPLFYKKTRPHTRILLEALAYKF